MATFPYPDLVPFNCSYAKGRAGCQVCKSIMWCVSVKHKISHKIIVLFIDHSQHSVTKSKSLFYCCCEHGLPLESAPM